MEVTWPKPKQLDDVCSGFSDVKLEDRLPGIGSVAGFPSIAVRQDEVLHTHSIAVLRPLIDFVSIRQVFAEALGLNDETRPPAMEQHIVGVVAFVIAFVACSVLGEHLAGIGEVPTKAGKGADRSMHSASSTRSS